MAIFTPTTSPLYLYSSSLLKGLHWLQLCVLYAALTLFASAAFCDAYSENGIEVSKRPWDQMDYMAFADALANGDIPLPRSNDAQSQHVFKKLVSKKNLHILDNRKIDSEEKLYFIADLIEALEPVAEIYALSMTDTNIDSSLANDLADIVLFSHDLTLRAYLLYQQEMAQQESERLVSLKEEASQMMKKSMFSILALGAAPDLLPEKSRLRLSSQFKDSAKKISGSLSNGAKTELLVAIKMVYAHPDTQLVKSHFRDAEKRLR